MEHVGPDVALFDLMTLANAGAIPLTEATLQLTAKRENILVAKTVVAPRKAFSALVCACTRLESMTPLSDLVPV